MASRARNGSLVAILLAAAAAVPASLAAQEDARLEAMASWVAMDAATGYETRVTPGMAEAMPGWSSDRWGNLVAVVGSGSPRRIVACALDRPSYAASQITGDGYLRVHRIGRGSTHPLWDQAFEAQPVRVLTRTGPGGGGGGAQQRPLRRPAPPRDRRGGGGRPVGGRGGRVGRGGGGPGDRAARPDRPPPPPVAAGGRGGGAGRRSPRGLRRRGHPGRCRARRPRALRGRPTS